LEEGPAGLSRAGRYAQPGAQEQNQPALAQLALNPLNQVDIVVPQVPLNIIVADNPAQPLSLTESTKRFLLGRVSVNAAIARGRQLSRLVLWWIMLVSLAWLLKGVWVHFLSIIFKFLCFVGIRIAYDAVGQLLTEYFGLLSAIGDALVAMVDNTAIRWGLPAPFSAPAPTWADLSWPSPTSAPEHHSSTVINATSRCPPVQCPSPPEYGYWHGVFHAINAVLCVSGALRLRLAQ
jgi:hypothetical protein